MHAKVQAYNEINHTDQTLVHPEDHNSVTQITDSSFSDNITTSTCMLNLEIEFLKTDNIFHQRPLHRKFERKTSFTQTWWTANYFG